MKILKGISASPGIGTGIMYLIPDQEQSSIIKKTIAKTEVNSHWARFLNAIEHVKQDIQALNNPSNSEQTAIFDTYLMMLEDPEFIGKLKKELESSLTNIEYILFTQYQELADTLRQTGDDYLSQRAEDICDVFGRVVNHLLGRKRLDIDTIPENAVIVARTLQTTDAVLMERRNPNAVLLEEGGINSHFAILARNYSIPAVFGLKELATSVRNGDTVIVNGDEGEIYINPEKSYTEKYIKELQLEEKRRKELSIFKDKPARTKDGTLLSVFANIGTAEEAAIAISEGADGIGLFRTEILFINENHILSEDEQYKVYKNVLQIMGSKPVTIRTLDAGADKVIPLEDITEADETNPLLGWRAIRFCLDHINLFKMQLRALFRAGVYGNLKIMFPLVSSYEELEKALAVIKDVKTELTAEKCAFNPDIPVGIMVETASAAVVSDFLAQKSAFFSIGTNDLTQYTLSVDRENTKVASLFNEFNPAVLRLIAQTVVNAQKAGIDVSVCGEMASRPEGAAVLTGLGIRQLSMGAKQLCAVKELLSRFTADEFAKMAENALKQMFSSDIKQKLSESISLRHS